MSARFRHRTVVAAVVAVLAAAGGGFAATCNLDLKRLPSERSSWGSRPPEEYVFRCTYPQGFFMQLEKGKARIHPAEPGAAEFSKVIKKEPAKYVSEHPFRGVAKLGSWEFGFVLDAASPKEQPAESKEKPKAETKAKPQVEEKGKTESKEKDKEKAQEEKKKEPPPPKVERYTRLYFDLNHNGDLTDDKVIEAERSEGNVYQGGSYAHASFPRVDVNTEVDGTPIQYAFFFSVYSNASKDFQYVSASLNAAVYRDGKIELAGKKRRVVLVDFNSNGRFGDRSKIPDNARGPEGRIYAEFGDMIYIDPTPDRLGRRSGYDVTSSDAQYNVSELINVDGQYYEVKISPAGDRLTLTPSSVTVGYVSNPNVGYRALVFDGNRVLKIWGDKDKKAPLPEGEWKLLSYTIDKTGYERPAETKGEKSADQKAEKPAEKQKEQSTWIATLVEALVGKGPANILAPPRLLYTVVSAQGTTTCKAVKVAKGKTIDLPFGPPYKPVVKPEYGEKDKVSLGMSLVGSAGEICSDLTVDGSRPEAPQFTIATPDGKEVEHGKFEYG